MDIQSSLLARRHSIMTSSYLPVLSGSVLKMHLHVGVDESGLLGKICTEMLDEAARQSTATSGMVTNQSVCYRLINCLRLTFCALDYIGCAVNSDTQSDFERIDETILLNQADQDCVEKARWLKKHYLEAYADDEKSLVRLMAIWNDFKHSAPSFVSLRTYDNTFYYLIGDVWVAVDDVTNYINEANLFARKYFTITGYEV